MKSFISIHTLILVGHRKNYTIGFFPGMNIIYGDSDTGKSSILEFVNYLLGASSIELADEVSASVKYAVLEFEISGTQYTVKRDIFNSKAHVEVYPCVFSECTRFFPKKYSTSFSDTTAPDGFYSDFLMDGLGFPKLKIKVSPSKIDSEVRRLGFRGLFKYVYANQDDIGSKNFLNLKDWVRSTQNREIFKYIFNVLDSAIAEHEELAAELKRQQNELLNKYKAVSDFLRETNHDTRVSLDEAMTEIDDAIGGFKSELDRVNSEMTASSETYQQLKAIFSEFSINEKRTALEITRTQDQIERYTRLRNDYENDIAKLRSSILAATRIGEAAIIECPCPVCNNIIDPSKTDIAFEVLDHSSLEVEMVSLQKRKASIQKLIQELIQKANELKADHIEFQSDLARVRELLDTEAKEMITPYLTQRDALIRELSMKEQERISLANNLKIRNQQDLIHDRYTRVGVSLADALEKLEALRAKAPSVQEVLSTLGDRFSKYLDLIKIKNRTGLGVSEKTYAPVVRGRDYVNITSGGLRTVVSIGYLLSLLEYAIDSEINHPRVLMIDTVGKYLGKTTKSEYLEETNLTEDEQEGISDPQKYQNIYEAFLAVAMRAEKNEVPCQIIVVDNDVPDSIIERYKHYVVAHYSSSGRDGLQLGLIDDIDSAMSTSGL